MPAASWPGAALLLLLPVVFLVSGALANRVGQGFYYSSSSSAPKDGKPLDWQKLRDRYPTSHGPWHKPGNGMGGNADRVFPDYPITAPADCTPIPSGKARWL